MKLQIDQSTNNEMNLESTCPEKLEQLKKDHIFEAQYKSIYPLCVSNSLLSFFLLYKKKDSVFECLNICTCLFTEDDMIEIIQTKYRGTYLS